MPRPTAWSTVAFQRVFGSASSSRPGRLGNRYPPSTPFGFSGGFYYVRLNCQWRTMG